MKVKTEQGRLRLKPLREQTIVITGATSGIGLVTTRLAARRGARVVISARNADELDRLARELRDQGHEVAVAPCDVGVAAEVEEVEQIAERHFGGFDTWVNNAGTALYGRILDVSLEEARRLFDTDFWGVVHGSRVAAEHLSNTGGGALINVGSVLSEVAVPLQGYYCAAKHALKGFTDSLRMELEEARLPVAVTLLEPAAIDTPYPHHGRSYLDHEPRNPPPVYAPEAVAKAILRCAVRPTRQVVVGGGGRLLISASRTAPRLMDRVMERLFFPLQQRTRPPRHRLDNLFAPSDDGQERGRYAFEGTLEHSLYTAAVLHPGLTASVVGAALLGAGYLLWPRRE